MMYESNYSRLLQQVMKEGKDIMDRTGVGTRSLIGLRLEAPAGAFPILQGKFVHFKSVVTELLWFLRGETNLRFLHEHGVSIWNEWAVDGELGPIYGHQWRKGSVDQVARIVEALGPGGDAFSRRLLVDAWQVADLHKMALPPCHMVWQVFVRAVDETTREIHLVTYQRSADLFLGVPFNLASYGLLQRLLCAWGEQAFLAAGTQVTYRPGKLVMNFGDAHVYANHFDAVAEYLSRKAPDSPPTVEIENLYPLAEVDRFVPGDFVLRDYHHLGRIPAPVAV